LRCNRANASEAKFCSECGAGLLRKFCPGCRAINDAESHFCQSCGEPLPAHPSAPAAPPMPPASIIPDLTDVFADPADAPVQFARPGLIGRPGESLSPSVPALAVAPEPGAAKATPTHRAPVLFGFVGGAAVLLVALWTHTDRTGAPASDHAVVASPGATPAQTTPPIAPPVPATGPAAAMSTAMPAATAAPAPVASPPTPLRAQTDASLPRGEAQSPAAPAPVPATAKDAGKARAKPVSPEALIAAQPPAAGPTPRRFDERPVSSVRSAAPTPDCTPHLDALGLCAPGAKVAGK
jgi:hypothetical protein